MPFAAALVYANMTASRSRIVGVCDDVVRVEEAVFVRQEISSEADPKDPALKMAGDFAIRC